MEKPELLFPMETGFEEEMVFTWYSIKPSLAINNFVSASYGEECGIEIVYQVEYNKKINKD